MKRFCASLVAAALLTGGLPAAAAQPRPADVLLPPLFFLLPPLPGWGQSAFLLDLFPAIPEEEADAAQPSRHSPVPEPDPAAPYEILLLEHPAYPMPIQAT